MPHIFDLRRPFSPDRGFSFATALPAELRREGLETPIPGLVLVLEDGRPLGPWVGDRERVRSLGKGCYSTGRRNICFSSSDGESCSDNQRRYQILWLAPEEKTQIQEIITDQLVSDDRLAVDMVGRVIAECAIFSRFFGTFQALSESLVRAGLPLPRSIIELGSGSHPLTSVRLLAEGAGHVIANDILGVEADFPPGMMQGLLRVLSVVDIGLARRLAEILINQPGGRGQIKGLEVLGGIPFEEVMVPHGTIDLVISFSALEHVMKPAVVYQKMIDVLRPGGHGVLSIDLRDHNCFYDPLRFLSLTPEQYAPSQTENRLRASDHIDLMEQIGFVVVDRQYHVLPKDWRQTLAVLWRQPSATGDLSCVDCVADVAAIEPAIGESTRTGFAAPFNQYDDRDLSIIHLTVVIRKPV